MYDEEVAVEQPRLPDIIFQTSCTKHSASNGEACWTIYQNTQNTKTNAVCSSRTKAAGWAKRGTAARRNRISITKDYN